MKKWATFFLQLCVVANAFAISYGDYIDNFDGVAIRSNIGNESNGTWQCVEFVKRYYSEFFGITIPSIGHANQYFGKASQISTVAHRNGSSARPRPGDILASNGTSENVGHVAIVREVSNTEVCVAQQNFFQDIRDVRYCVSMSGNAASGYRVSQLDSKHTVTGWLRPFCNGTCYISKVGNVAWYPKAPSCARATQWFWVADPAKVIPATVDACPQSCPAN